MLTKNDILNFLRSRDKFLRENFGVEKISLFGSFARGEQTDESDIDFFVEMPADFFKRCKLIEYLEDNFQRKVDVVRKHSNIRPRFLEEIEKDRVNA